MSGEGERTEERPDFRVITAKVGRGPDARAGVSVIDKEGNIDVRERDLPPHLASKRAKEIADQLREEGHKVKLRDRTRKVPPPSDNPFYK